MKFREQNQLDKNGIDSLMQWLQFLNIRKEQLIMPYKSRYSLMEQYPTLRFLLLMLSTIPIMRYHLMNEEFLKEAFVIKVQERYVLKHLNLQIRKSPIGFSFHIMELVN